MNDEKWVADSDMEDIAGGAGKKGASKESKGKVGIDGDSKPADPSKPGVSGGGYKETKKGK